MIKFIRDDIVNVKADAVVNTANPFPVIGGGADSAIYEAAGQEKLLAERKKIGNIERGEARITSGFALSDFIIHTVGPKYIDGSYDEEKTLRSCYRNSLQLAKENQCHSIVFPLISTGVYGFPKEEAIVIAVDEIHRFLIKDNSRMLVKMAILDDESYALCLKIATLETNINSQDSVSQLKNEYGFYYNEVIERNRKPKRKKAVQSQTITENEMSCDRKSFADMVLYYVGKREEKASVFYNAVGIDRRLFSKITTQDYHPSKETAIKMCIGLRLTLSQTIDLLSRADYSFNPSKPEDLIVFQGIKQGKTYAQIKKDLEDIHIYW